MTDLIISGTQSSPEVHGDWQRGILALAGDSYPENAFEIFDRIIGWVKSYLAAETRQLALELQLVYLNTSSVKAMMDIFDLLQAAAENGRMVAVTWHFDSRNERVGELAAEFKEDYTFPFAILPVE